MSGKQNVVSFQRNRENRAPQLQAQELAVDSVEKARANLALRHTALRLCEVMLCEAGGRKALDPADAMAALALAAKIYPKLFDSSFF